MSGQASMPTIREEHVTTADGVDIACFECGEGPPCVMVSAPPFVDTRLQWRSPVLLESTPVAVLAQTHRVIQFDPRGCGSSQRNVRDYSLASRIEDYKAVMERYASHPIPLIAAVSSVAASRQRPADGAHCQGHARHRCCSGGTGWSPCADGHRARHRPARDRRARS